jgi:hypothetical protein
LQHQTYLFLFLLLGLNARSNKNSFSSRNLHNIIDRALPSEIESGESEILDLTLGSLKPNTNNWQHYGSVSNLPTVGKNNLPRGGKVANAFCYNGFNEQSRAATPSQINPNVMFFRRSDSVMASVRSINRTVGSIHIGTSNNVALY